MVAETLPNTPSKTLIGSMKGTAGIEYQTWSEPLELAAIVDLMQPNLRTGGRKPTLPVESQLSVLPDTSFSRNSNRITRW
jgi:hypothetical protein